MWQILKRIESLVKEQSQHQNGINDKLTVLKKHQAATIASPKPPTLAVIAANKKTCSPSYKKKNRIVVKLNDFASAEEMNKQAPEKMAYRIDAYLVENNITATKFYVAQTLPSQNIDQQRTNVAEAKKLKGEDGWTRMLGNNAKLTRKQYDIVALGIPIAKIEMKKLEEKKEKIVTQNTSIFAGMNIESIFWLSTSKKDRRTFITSS